MTATPRQARFEATLGRLRAEVAGGAIGVDGLLPGERDLAGRLGVSRTTLRRMLSILAGEGVLTHRQGVGTFVSTVLRPERPAQAPVPVDQTRLGGFSDAILRLGALPSSRQVVRRLTLPTPADALALGCPPGEPVVVLERLRCMDDVAVALERAVLPGWALPEAVAVDGSLYDALARAGAAPTRALQRAGVGQASAAEARGLGLVPGRPVIRLDRADYLADGRCCARTASAMRADCFDLAVDLRAGGPPLMRPAPEPAGAVEGR